MVRLSGRPYHRNPCLRKRNEVSFQQAFRSRPSLRHGKYDSRNRMKARPLKLRRSFKYFIKAGRSDIWRLDGKGWSWTPKLQRYRDNWVYYTHDEWIPKEFIDCGWTQLSHQEFVKMLNES